MCALVLPACDDPGGRAASQPKALTTPCQLAADEICRLLDDCSDWRDWKLRSDRDPDDVLSGTNYVWRGGCTDVLLAGTFGNFTCDFRQEDPLLACIEQIEVSACGTYTGVGGDGWDMRSGGRADVLDALWSPECTY